MGVSIKFQIKGRIFDICIGHTTEWFQQVPLISITEEFYHNYQVEYATWLWDSRRLKFWRK